MKLTKQQRLARLKPAVEIVEDELNRLTEDEAQEPFDGWQKDDAFYEVIRHLKARWGELNAELNGGNDAER